MKERIETNQDRIKIWVQDIAIAFIIVGIITTWFAQNMRVVGGSMDPTLSHHDMVIINKIVYQFTAPKKGEVIGFTIDDYDKVLVKRVIGTAGDVITYEEGMMFVNGVPIEGKQAQEMRARGDIVYPYVVPADNYFVIGDNWNESVDSRYSNVGCIKEEQLVGRIDWSLWPFGRIGSH